MTTGRKLKLAVVDNANGLRAALTYVILVPIIAAIYTLSLMLLRGWHRPAEINSMHDHLTAILHRILVILIVTPAVAVSHILPHRLSTWNFGIVVVVITGLIFGTIAVWLGRRIGQRASRQTLKQHSEQAG